MANSNQNWAAVPVLVQDLYVKYAGAARELVAGEQNHPAGWVLETEEIGPVLAKWAEAPSAGIEMPRGNPADIDAPAIHEGGAGFFPAVGQTSRNIQSAIGGPNPLTSMLLHGALAAGLGAGGGWLLHKLLPRLFNKRTPLAFGVLGGLGGAAGPFLTHGVPALKHQGWRGLFTQQPLQGGEPYADMQGISPRLYSANADVDRMAAGGRWDARERGWKYPDDVATAQYGPLPGDPDFPKPGASSRFSGILDRLTEELGVKCASDDFEKHALAGAEFLPSIPTDEWGRVVMRDPFLENPEKAIAAGLPAAAGAVRGSKWVSPRDVAGIAANAGLGYGFGYLGSLAAKFLGLTEPVQKGLQRAGLLAGAIRGITGMM